VSVDEGEKLPGLRLRVHKAREHCEGREIGADASNGYVDIALNQSVDACIRI
jgi:hypothetical protein